MLKNTPIIDCDLHQTYKHQSELYPYLSEPVLSRIKEKGLGYPRDFFHRTINGNRLDSANEDGTVGGSEYSKVKQDWMDKHNITFAVLTGGGSINISLMPNVDVAIALSSAYNHWMVDNWLAKDNRFLGSLHLALQDPEHAAAEIYKWAGHDQIVQILLPAVTLLPISHPTYAPVLRALNETGLVLGFHFTQPAANNFTYTSIGPVNSYYDFHSLISLPYQAQLVNLITSGAFENYPNLKILFLEGGFTWLPHFLWRMDKEYKALWQEVPKMKKMPSEYILQHFRFGAQPVEEPENNTHFQQIVEMVHGKNLLVYAGDYPHWDADEPKFAAKFFKPEYHQKIFFENAAILYDIKF